MSDQIELPPLAPWAGFWRRVAAFVVDGLILGIVGWLLGLAAFDALASLGSTGRLIGLVIAVAYFGVMGSAVGRGQTLGKRLLKIRVIRGGGGFLGVAPALGRAFVVVIPGIMNGWMLAYSNSPAAWAFGVVAVLTVFGLGLAQIYLLLFNRPERRLVHDLIFGTIVVRAEAESASSSPVARLHAIVVAAIFVAALAIVLFLPLLLPATLKKTLADLTPVQHALDARPEVLQSGVNDNTSMYQESGHGSVTTRTLSVSVSLRHWPANTAAETAAIAGVVIGKYHFAPGQRLQIRLVNGFDIGIASGSRGWTDTEAPSHWSATAH